MYMNSKIYMLITQICHVHEQQKLYAHNTNMPCHEQQTLYSHKTNMPCHEQQKLYSHNTNMPCHEQQKLYCGIKTLTTDI
jgi:hypothetical protein